MIETTREHLVVMDMQPFFLEGKSSSSVDAVVKVINHMSHAFHELGLPITICEFDPISFGNTIESIDIYPGTSIVVKDDANAFHSSDFESQVLSSGTLIITGCYVESCIRITAENALSKGYKVIVPANAILSENFFPNLLRQIISKVTSKGQRIYNIREM